MKVFLKEKRLLILGERAAVFILYHRATNTNNLSDNVMDQDQLDCSNSSKNLAIQDLQSVFCGPQTGEDFSNAAGFVPNLHWSIQCNISREVWKE